jgi:hypothetical protein
MTSFRLHTSACVGGGTRAGWQHPLLVSRATLLSSAGHISRGPDRYPKYVSPKPCGTFGEGVRVQLTSSRDGLPTFVCSSMCLSAALSTVQFVLATESTNSQPASQQLMKFHHDVLAGCA